MKLRISPWPFLILFGSIGLGVIGAASYLGPRFFDSLTRDTSASGPDSGGLYPGEPPTVVVPVHESELVELQSRIFAGVRKALPATVAVRHTRLPSAASGVIISADGLVLSQWHVTHAMRTSESGRQSWSAGEPTIVVLSDGREVRAKLLGASVAHDLSLLQIVDPGPFPFAPLAPNLAVKTGDWVMKIGHPGHYRPKRPAMVRLGRVVACHPTGFVTDCLINGGDSGGPFFDVEGRLIGLVRGSTADIASMWPDTGNRLRDVNWYLFAATSNAVIQGDMESMLQGAVGSGNQASYDLVLKRSPRLHIDDWVEGETTRKAFSKIAAMQKNSIAGIYVADVCVGLATVASTATDSALLIAKASELPPVFTCRFRDGQECAAEVIHTDEPFDLSVLQVKVNGLTPIRWAESRAPRQGEFVVAAGMEDVPLAVGIVSVPVLDKMEGNPPVSAEEKTKLSVSLPFHGRLEPGVGYRVDHIIEKIDFLAGIRKNDILRTINGKSIATEHELTSEIRGQFGVNQLEVKRGNETISLKWPALSRLQKGINNRSAGFPRVFEVAAPLAASDCGAPLLNLQGEAIGVLIARYDLQGCKAISSSEVTTILEQAKKKHALKPR